MNSVSSLRDDLQSSESETLLPELLPRLSVRAREEFIKCWLLWARGTQRPPERAQNGAPWTTWLFLGGRGAGKTRAGAEWVRGIVRGVT